MGNCQFGFTARVAGRSDMKLNANDSVGCSVTSQRTVAFLITASALISSVRSFVYALYGTLSSITVV